MGLKGFMNENQATNTTGDKPLQDFFTTLQKVNENSQKAQVLTERLSIISNEEAYLIGQIKGIVEDTSFLISHLASLFEEEPDVEEHA